MRKIYVWQGALYFVLWECWPVRRNVACWVEARKSGVNLQLLQVLLREVHRTLFVDT